MYPLGTGSEAHFIFFALLEVYNQQNYECNYEDDSRQCIHGWSDADFDLAVDQCGDGVDAGSTSKVCDDEVID